MTTKDGAPPASLVQDAIPEPKDRTDGLTTDKWKSEKEKEEKAAPIGNYWRILSYGSKVNHCLMLAALGASMASGVPLPLMNIFFGKLVGNFNGYFIPNGGVTKAEFKHSVSMNALYIIYLFIAKFFLMYIALVRSPIKVAPQLMTLNSSPFVQRVFASLQVFDSLT